MLNTAIMGNPINWIIIFIMISIALVGTHIFIK